MKVDREEECEGKKEGIMNLPIVVRRKKGGKEGGKEGRW
jgi:hypothetical protein